MFKITSSSNQFIKDIKKLNRKRNRWKEKKYIIEGIKIIEEAINENLKLNYIVYSEEALQNDELNKLLNTIENKATLVEVSNSIFEEISDTENPQGVLGVLSFDINNCDDIRKYNQANFIFLDALQDPGNLGTIIRSADAFNISGIILGEGCVDPYNQKVVRSTMGSIFRVPIYMCENSITFLEDIKENGFNIISTDLNGLELSEGLKNLNKNIFIIGNESKGVREEYLNLSNKRIKIPMPGKAESLNAGVAASIIMYEITKG